MDISSCIFTKSNCYMRARTIKPQGLMIHSTGANNPELRRYVAPDDGILGKNTYDNDWNRPGLDVCVHAFIGKDKVGKVRCYQTLPWNFRGWHAGADANNTHMAVEICEDGLTDRAYFEETRDLAIGLAAHLCRLYGLNPLGDGVLLDHAEGYARGIASNHGDVKHWWSRFGYTMGDFRQAVAKQLKEAEPQPQPQTQRIYETLDDIPNWGKEAVKAALEKGALAGEGSGKLNLSYDFLRTLQVLHALNLF